jgi:hypothetical protein
MGYVYAELMAVNCDVTHTCLVTELSNSRVSGLNNYRHADFNDPINMLDIWTTNSSYKYAQFGQQMNNVFLKIHAKIAAINQHREVFLKHDVSYLRHHLRSLLITYYQSSLSSAKAKETAVTRPFSLSTQISPPCETIIC